MQQEKTILKENSDCFLVRRNIYYETGFERELDLVGVRYEIWGSSYKGKYEKDIIQEYSDGRAIWYCQLYTAETDQEMLEIFDKVTKCRE